MRNNQPLWEKIVEEVRADEKGGKKGEWSARKAQMAVRIYKERGGGYTTKKSENSLEKWTKQDWDYVNPSDAKKPRDQRGRYLPASVREKLTKSEKAETNRKKREATKKGKQYASYSRAVARMVRVA